MSAKTPQLKDAVPSERDISIFEAICLKGRKADAVAAELGIAPTTVRNVALQTQRNLAKRQFTTMRMGSLDGLRLQYLQLHTQRELMMGSFYESREALVTTLVVESEATGKTTRTSTRPQYGNPRYLLHARKIAAEKDLLEAEIERREALAASETEVESPAVVEASEPTAPAESPSIVTPPASVELPTADTFPAPNEAPSRPRTRAERRDRQRLLAQFQNDRAAQARQLSRAS